MMKTQGDRIKHLREKVLCMTKKDFSERAQISFRSLITIEADGGGERALLDVISSLNLNPEWVEKGKGNIFAEGTEHENVIRIRAIAPADRSIPSEPWRDEAYQQIKAERDQLREWMNKLVGKISFRKAPGQATHHRAAA